MSKSWHEMTPEERLADRIAKNRAMEKRISEKVVPEKKTASGEVATRQRAVRNALDRFQQIKATQGMDAAADFVRSHTMVEETGE
jgi:hypothetical protein